jgi:hypothetical protein
MYCSAGMVDDGVIAPAYLWEVILATLEFSKKWRYWTAGEYPRCLVLLSAGWIFTGILSQMACCFCCIESEVNTEKSREVDIN